MIKNFKNYYKINEEAAPRLPKSEEYWLKKGKKGKEVALYTHDDMDGLVSAIEMKKWLLNKGFKIVKYGILNYTEGWKYTTVNPELINIVLDFANMPGDERDNDIDYYLDHHGLFSTEEIERYKSLPIQKKQSGSAYEVICQALGVPQDELTVSVIDMIDAAKYEDYEVSWQRLLDFNLSDIKTSKNVRLEFAAAFNQFLKRSDSQTLIAVIHNCNDASIYSIFNVMSKIYPVYNKWTAGMSKGKPKEFKADSEWRLGTMQKRTRGNSPKVVIKSQKEFLDKFVSGGLVRMDGYQIIGDLVFIPTGTWANALRARSIVERDYLDGVIDVEPKFILLQYGGTLQVCSYKKMSQIIELPVLKNGSKVDDLGKYMTSLLRNFQAHLGYHNPDTSIGQDEITVSGGHGGIGSISNIFGECQVDPYKGMRFIDLFKNKIISDLSGVKLGMSIKWSEPSEYDKSEPEMDNKVINTEDIVKLDRFGRLPGDVL